MIFWYRFVTSNKRQNLDNQKIISLSLMDLLIFLVLFPSQYYCIRAKLSSSSSQGLKNGTVCLLLLTFFRRHQNLRFNLIHFLQGQLLYINSYAFKNALCVYLEIHNSKWSGSDDVLTADYLTKYRLSFFQLLMYVAYFW